MLLPQPRGEFGDAGDALEDVDQIGVGVDVVQSAGTDQAVDDAHVLGAKFGPAEVPVFTTHGDDAQGAFEVVGVDGDVGVAEEYLKSRATIACVGQRLGQGITGH